MSRICFYVVLSCAVEQCMTQLPHNDQSPAVSAESVHIISVLDLSSVNLHYRVYLM